MRKKKKEKKNQEKKMIFFTSKSHEEFGDLKIDIFGQLNDSQISS